MAAPYLHGTRVGHVRWVDETAARLPEYRKRWHAKPAAACCCGVMDVDENSDGETGDNSEFVAYLAMLARVRVILTSEPQASCNLRDDELWLMALLQQAWVGDSASMVRVRPEFEALCARLEGKRSES